MPLSSDGKERRRVAPKEKRKRSKSFTLHLVWVKRVCVIQTISPGEDWSHRDLGPVFLEMISTSRTYSTKNLLKVGSLGALDKPFVTSRDQLSFLLHLLSISYFHYFSLSFCTVLALAHLSYVGISRKHFFPQARSWCKLIFTHSEETWLSKTSKNLIIKCFNDDNSSMWSFPEV